MTSFCCNKSDEKGPIHTTFSKNYFSQLKKGTPHPFAEKSGTPPTLVFTYAAGINILVLLCRYVQLYNWSYFIAAVIRKTTPVHYCSSLTKTGTLAYSKNILRVIQPPLVLHGTVYFTFLHIHV
jgi:hypothetical protein